jgi:hypothetical protein
LLYDAAILLKEISGFVAHLFDRGVPIARSSNVSMPFSRDNPPPLVGILDFFKSSLDLCSYETILIIHQDLYPAQLVDAEVSNSTHNGQDDTMSSDNGGQGAPLAEPIVPHLIGSGTVTQVRPSAADQPTTAVPLGSGLTKKKRLVLASKSKQPTRSDQVTTELFPHYVPCCSPDLVVVKLVFGCLFEALQWPTQAAKIDTSAGANIQPAKRLRAPPMQKMLAPRCVIVLMCALLLVAFSKFS